MIPVDDVITLVSYTKQKDAYGVDRETATTREVLAQVHSITRAEFFDGGRNGLNPSYEFTVFAGNYNGEEVCQFHGEQYAIYRTYLVPGTDYIELYVERKGGTNYIPEEDDGTQSGND